MVIIESLKPTKIEEKKETAIDLEKELLQMIEQSTDKQDGKKETQNNEESKEEYKNEMKEKKTANTKVKAEEVSDSMKEALDMVMIELDRIEESAKQSFVHEKFNRAYQEYKDGLRSLSDLVIRERENPPLREIYEERRRKFAINVAAACIKIRHYEQGLEASNLVLEKPSDDNQYKKAIYRAGVCYRGLGDFENANKTFRKLLNESDLDGLVRRDILRQLKGIVQEKRRNKEMARGMMSGKGDNLIEPEKKQDSPEELRLSEEIEERRHAYLASEKNRDMPQNKNPVKRNISAPEIMITEEECLWILDTLVELYADRAVQDELKQATFDHNFNFSKGFIIRSRKILMPLQRDVLEKYGFLNFNDINSPSDEDYTDAHYNALKKLSHTVRYLGEKNIDIKRKASTCETLAKGDCMMNQC